MRGTAPLRFVEGIAQKMAKFVEIFRQRIFAGASLFDGV